jgi:SAM-dependent methyltransferase
MHADPHADPREFWEGFYEDRDRWPSRPNGVLVDEAGALAPGRALDLGCGHGGDAIWLAERGWRVTAVDLSANALERAAERARDAGVGDAIEWQQRDLATGLPAGEWDLVSACYLHAPVALPRTAILRAAADAVAPGGTLLIVGHAGPPSWAADARMPVDLPTPDRLLDELALPAGAWTVVRSAEVERAATAPDGLPGTRPDNLLRLRRR